MGSITLVHLILYIFIHTENKSNADHYAKVGALDYEVPQKSLQQEGVYELEPCNNTTESVYEPVVDGNIYSTPCLATKVRGLMHNIYRILSRILLIVV